MSSSDVDAQTEFFQLATQYYVAGRFSFLSFLLPMGCNLLHHAIEMYLKGALAKTESLKDLRDLGHDLTKIWCRFKTAFPDTTLDSFDSAVRDLHRFERLRYPDAALTEGMVAYTAIYRGDLVQVADGKKPPLPTYQLALEDIDDLVKVVFSRANVNPSFYLAHLQDSAKQFLDLRNAHPLVVEA